MGTRTIGRKTFGRQTFGRQTLGRQDIWPTDVWPTGHLVDRTLGRQTFSRHTSSLYIKNTCIVYVCCKGIWKGKYIWPACSKQYFWLVAFLTKKQLPKHHRAHTFPTHLFIPLPLHQNTLQHRCLLNQQNVTKNHSKPLKKRKPVGYFSTNG